MPTIRFYEQIGLLPEPERTASERRVYGSEDLKRLTFISHARQLGFSVDAVRTLLTVANSPSTGCSDANRLAAEQLILVEEKIPKLNDLAAQLRVIAAAECSGAAADCQVLDALQRHSSHCPHEAAPAGSPESA